MPDDLSEHHGLISNLFALPSSAEEWARHRLSDGQVAFYKENGYVAGVRVLSDEQVEALRGELEELADPSHPKHRLFYEFHSNESKDPATTLFHALGAWRIARGFHDLLWNPAITVPASQLLEGAVRFWHDQLFCKPARHGGVVAWHQDYSYWTRTRPLAHLTCWIGLDDSTRDNGCLHYVPGSHRWPDLPITGLAGDMDAIHRVLAEGHKKEFEPVAIELKKGEASFHHPKMIHGSYANLTGGPRRAAVINVFKDGVRSASDEPLLEGVPPIPSGEKMCGQFFPLLFDPESLSGDLGAQDRQDKDLMAL
ncbi:MAG TPA: phytanoyl-CoA dioxygenase family protein [Blastocatellia bacterium]|jgi:ectoine hydroxylase-related dioxygenase (phytanoyl-CoA dioxygenase family)|nr:phytanoyl-CoA dioxygenase family protein [Blastocatellia bacterium]